MRIDKIKITNFRIFDDVTFELGKNLTCIAGHNGVGKSTLLAILSNIGELKKSEGTHINGNPFRGEFSQIIHGDKPYDTTGEKCTIFFKDLPHTNNSNNPFVNQLSFRSTFQKATRKKEVREKLNCTIDGENKEFTIVKIIEEKKKADRYRLLPITSDDRKTESKLPWPTYYLGLSRLYPVGESEDITIKNKEDIPMDIQAEILHAHAKILNSPHEYLESSSIEIADTRKKGFGIKTESFSEKMNSAGQDNLGQILYSVYSFELLKDSLKDKYNGGLLLIDEIDATLHPVAQNRLIDLLYRKSKELNLQIVFTTHSLSLLEHIAKKQKNSKDKENFQTLYITNKRLKLEPINNPEITYIRNDLMNTYAGAIRSNKVSVFTEDDTARWFLNKIITYNKSAHTLDLNLIEMNVGWTEIIKLIKNDPFYYQNHLIILDPDINDPNTKADLSHHLRGTPYSFNKKQSNIFILPGTCYIEKLMWEYLNSLEADDSFFYNPIIEQSGVNKQSLEDFGPLSEEYKKEYDEKKKIKAWFEQNKWICDIAFEFWIKTEENTIQVASFFDLLLNSYKTIQHRLR